ncbi:MAG TPA: MlaD family protein [Solirubrobacteraceae bacterium]|jgi:phospholipid/cholesterol/gamma-HCH transport system substrate-binding protein|nr:MlaD family protein [Solirubrobacteraceae bacterium]
MSRVRWWKRYDEMPVVELQKSNPVRFGLVVIVITAIVVYFGFTKHIPFKHGFRLKAVFATAVNISPKSPVRIAGVNVGTVSSIQREGNTGVVTMEISKEGLPIHRDATVKIRARILLEGNWFVDLQPGTPSSPTVSSGYTIPITHSSDPVQLDQVLDALNTDTRSNLQTLLAEFGSALTRKPTAAQDAEQNPAVRGLTAAQALKKLYVDSPEALKGGAIVNQALGGVEQHDLSKMIAGIEKLTAALNVHEQQLGEWVGNFNTFLGAFAAQSASLSGAIAELPGTFQNAGRALANLNAATPTIRKFSLELVPGVEQTPSTIEAAFPWIEQTQASLAPTELGGVAKGVREAAPTIAGLVVPQPAFFKQTDLFSKCLSTIFYPAGNTKLQDGSSTSGVEIYKEFWYAMAGVAGIAQSFDGNGQTGRFMIETGGNTLRSAPATVVGASSGKGLRLLAHTSQSPLGTSPAFPATEPPYKPLVPCYTQTPQNLNGALAHGPADGSEP